mmetsp:Transcript_46369/g.99316  ORF Transcript_46369/g.99316 Transcript_46369/m.99316 type:complete len:155 (+) Transcript_46369:678-1142(+)
MLEVVPLTEESECLSALLAASGVDVDDLACDYGQQLRQAVGQWQRRKRLCMEALEGVRSRLERELDAAENSSLLPSDSGPPPLLLQGAANEGGGDASDDNNNNNIDDEDDGGGGGRRRRGCGGVSLKDVIARYGLVTDEAAGCEVPEGLAELAL